MKKRHISMLSALVVAMGALGVTLPMMINSSNDTQVMQPKESEYDPFNFVDNREKIFSTIEQKSQEVFNEDTPWADFSKDPDDSQYKPIFEKSSNEVILNDIKIWLQSLLNEKHSNFKMYIDDIQVDNTKYESGQVNSKIKIDFQIYNNSDKNKMLVLPGVVKYVGFRPYEIVDNSITIDAPLNNVFYQKGDDLWAGYNFDSADWKIRSDVNTVKNFQFTEYSHTINTVVKNASTGDGYYDIKELGNAKLTTLTGEIIANEILSDNDALLKAVSDNLAPVQIILQKLVENKPTTVFLKDIADSVKKVIENVLESGDPKLEGIGNLVSDLLQDKKVIDIILNNKSVIVSLMIMMGLDDETFTGMITNADEQSLASLLDSVSDMELIPGSTEEIRAIIEQSKSLGVISLLKANTLVLIDIIKSLVPADDANVSLALALLDVVDLGNQDKPILEVLVGVCNAKDDKGASLLKQLFDSLLGNSALASFGTILDQALFNNSNLTVGNLKTSLNALANPKDGKGSGTVVNYKEWWDKMEIKNIINKAQYDQSTHMANIDVEVRFNFNKDLWINVSELVKILPPNLSIDGTSIPTGLLGSVVPDWVAIKKNDYVANNIKIDNIIHYDVVRNKYGKDVLSWQASAHSIIDVNMPQTVQVLWENSTIGTGDLIKNLTTSMVYHKYSEYKRFRPKASILNQTEVKNYNYNRKYDVALTSKVTPELLAQINTEITNNMHMVTLADKYQWKSGSWIFVKTHTIYKTESRNDFARSELFNRIFDVVNGELQVPLYLEFNSEFIIPETKFVFFTIPMVLTNKICFWSPNDIYVDGKMENDWAYTLA